MKQKENELITVNILAHRKLKHETEKAVLFSIPNHRGLSVWINKKCIHTSHNSKMISVRIKANGEYMIWISVNETQLNPKIHHVKSEIWQGQHLIDLYQSEFKKIVDWLNKQQSLNK